MPLPRIQRGHVIRASFLNDIANDVDDLTRRFASRPRQIEDVLPGRVQNESAQENNSEATSPNVFLEVSRTSSTIQVFDQNETNYAEVSRIDQVFFKNALGETITLKFNNTG